MKLMITMSKTRIPICLTSFLMPDDTRHIKWVPTVSIKKSDTKFNVSVLHLYLKGMTQGRKLFLIPQNSILPPPLINPKELAD